MAQKDQNSVVNEKLNFINPVSLAKITFCLLLIKFNAFEGAKNTILTPFEPQVIALPKQKQILPKKSAKPKKSTITFMKLTLFRKIQRTKREIAEKITYSSFKI
jgi:hypothetical protein